MYVNETHKYILGKPFSSVSCRCCLECTLLDDDDDDDDEDDDGCSAIRIDYMTKKRRQTTKKSNAARCIFTMMRNVCLRTKWSALCVYFCSVRYKSHTNTVCVSGLVLCPISTSSRNWFCLRHLTHSAISSKFSLTFTHDKKRYSILLDCCCCVCVCVLHAVCSCLCLCEWDCYRICIMCVCMPLRGACVCVIFCRKIEGWMRARVRTQ